VDHFIGAVAGFNEFWGNLEILQIVCLGVHVFLHVNDELSHGSLRLSFQHIILLIEVDWVLSVAEFAD